MHPPSTQFPGRYRSSLLRPGWPRHTGEPAYRCFLPDLAGFTGSHCEGPSLRHHLPRADSTKLRLGAGIRPRYSGLRVQGTARSPSSTTETCTGWSPDTTSSTAYWRRGRDSNPRDRVTVYSLSRRAPSTTQPPLRIVAESLAITPATLAEREGFEPSRQGHRLLAFEASAFNRSATSPRPPEPSGAPLEPDATTARTSLPSPWG